MSDTNTVTSLHGSEVQLSEDDARVIQSILANIADVHAALGAEEERHIREKSRLMGVLTEARTSYQSLVDYFGRKYVRRPGRFTFQPTKSAFVEER